MLVRNQMTSGSVSSSVEQHIVIIIIGKEGVKVSEIHHISHMIKDLACHDL